MPAYHTVMGSNNARLDGFVVTGGNTAGADPGVDSYGAGIFNSGDDPTIVNCTITGNIADRGAGIYNINSSNPTIENCNITLNVASVHGGALYSAINCAFTMANCYVASNTATTEDGGGIYNFQPSTLDATNCTINSNTADVGGGLYTASTATANLTNCIVWGNTGTTSNDNLYEDASLITANYSCFASTVTGTGNINANPEFNDAGSGNLTLDETEPSPCIDSGTAVSGTYPNVPSDDYLGNSRPSGAGVDMGAYEYQVP